MVINVLYTELGKDPIFQNPTMENLNNISVVGRLKTKFLMTYRYKMDYMKNTTQIWIVSSLTDFSLHICSSYSTVTNYMSSCPCCPIPSGWWLVDERPTPTHIFSWCGKVKMFISNIIYLRLGKTWGIRHPKLNS